MIKVLLFAEMQERAGTKEISVEESPLTVKELKDNHLKKYEMDELFEQAMLAVNEDYAEDDTIIESGDVVAFIPPVSGG